MTLSDWISLVTVISFPIYVLVTIYTATQVEGYIRGNYSLSSLGCPSVSKGHRFFNWVTFFYGTLLITFALTLRKLEGDSIPNLLTIAQTVVGFSTAFVSLVPTDKSRLWHNLIGGAMFPAAVVASFFSLGTWTNVLLVRVVNMATLFVAALMLMDATHTISKKPRGHLNWYIEWVFVFLMGMHFATLALYALE